MSRLGSLGERGQGVKPDGCSSAARTGKSKRPPRFLPGAAKSAAKLRMGYLYGSTSQRGSTNAIDADCIARIEIRKSLRH